LVRQGASIIVTRSVGAVLSVVLTVLISRVLGPSDLGRYAYAVALLTLMTIPLSYGWAPLLLRTAAGAVHNARWGLVRGLARRGVHYAILISAAVLLIGLVKLWWFPVWATSYFAAVLLAAILMLDQFSALRMAMLRAFDWPVIGQLPEQVVRPLLTIVFFSTAFLMFGAQTSLDDAFAALFAASVGSAGLGYVALRRAAPPEVRTTTPVFEDRSWVASASMMAMNSGFMVLNAFIDIIILGFFVDVAEVGVYRVALQFAMIGNLAYVALNMLANQRFALLAASNDPKAGASVARFLARLALLAALPVPVILLFAGEPLIRTIFGAAFVPALTPALILCLLHVVNAATGMSYAYLTTHKYEHKIVRWPLICCALNVLLCLLLIPPLGVVGAALSTTIATAFWAVALTITCRKLTGVDTSLLGRANARIPEAVPLPA
jgi:O-antigen/teichoic acid export membrane protein